MKHRILLISKIQFFSVGLVLFLLVGLTGVVLAAPPVINDQTFSVAENSATGTFVGDVDPADSATTYAITAGNDSGAFAINSANGDITVLDGTQLDYETTTYFTLTVQAANGDGSDTATITINVINVNDAPVITSGQTFNVAENSPSGTSVGTVLATDPDGNTLTYSIIAGNTGNAFMINASTGEIQVQTSSVLNFETGPTQYDLIISVTDGGLSDTDVVTINVTDANDPPAAVDDNGYTTAENAPLNGATPSVVNNDTDEDGDALTAVLDAGPANGTLDLHSSGVFTYTPNAGFNGVDTFTYYANDSITNSLNTAVVTITVTGSNDPPVANDDVDDLFATNEDTVLNVSAPSVLDNDTDPENDTLTVAFFITSSVQGAAVAVNADGSFSYDPTGVANLQALPQGGIITDTFTYVITDGAALSAAATVSVTVTGVNDAPEAVDDPGYTMVQNTTLVSNTILLNDTDVDTGTTLTAALDTSTSNGSLQLDSSGVFTYTPNTGFDGVDTFTYYVNDGLANSPATATVTIMISGNNDAPTAVDDNYTTPEDTQLVAASVLGNDSDPEFDSLTAVLDSGPSNGSLTLDSSGVFTYTPDADFSGVDTFTYHANDGSLNSSPATVTITVTAVNDSPIANDDLGYATTEDTPLNDATSSVLDNDSDPDGDPLTVVNYNQPANGSVTVDSTGVFTYTPNLNFNGTDTFTYYANDGTADSATPATVTITVSPANDAPTDISLSPGSIAENNSVGDSAGNFSTTDPDGDTTFIYVLTDTASFPDNNSFQISGGQLQANVVFDYEPKNSYTIRVRSTDSGGLWTEKTLVVSITDVNEPPTDVTLDNNTVAENQPPGAYIGQLSVTDLDSSSFTYSLPSGAADNNLFTVLVNTGQLYTNATFNYEVQASYIISVTVNDGSNNFQKALTIQITDANEAPTAVDDTGQTTDEDTVLNVAAANGVLSNDTDPEGDTLTVSGADSASAQGAAVTVNADGSYSYDPTGAAALQALAVGESLNDTFAYTVSDGNGGEAAGTVTIQVTGANDAPTARDDTASTLKDTAVTINVRSNDTDPDASDTLTITAVTQGALGSVTHDGATVTYTPNAGVEGDDNFTYTISDGNITATAAVTVSIGLQYVYLPVILNPGPAVNAPDLVVTNVSASSSEVQVTIRNQGNVATAAGFWVDFYVAPNPVPTHANQLWDDLGSEGIAWGITIPVNAGESLTLTYSTAPGAPNTFVSADDTNFTGTMAAGTAVYAQVDSAHVGNVNGAIEETHEILGEAYNNVSQMYTSMATGTAADTAVFLPDAAETDFSLPVR